MHLLQKKKNIAYASNEEKLIRQDRFQIYRVMSWK